ncbi:integral membrane sensor signal transduction histidine kinase [Anaeromyxobacter sp. K]|uniref:sensor histidine kinase n=1 Tax=Anaeromyxobacter sp. (strain K) TaxID=447217 RepID=UPI00015F9C23|nr:ATP-binding protein [Anaeromyxobacter sp. K]ACG74679.1 integral membrane sensor signal transduction histidine kinase [Anaeromyxobacter sp. K]
MPFWRRLSTKLLAAVVLLALLALAAVVLAERRFERHLQDEIVRSTALVGEAVTTVGQATLLGATERHEYRTIGRLAALEGVDRMRVLDPRGTVRFASRPEEIGQTRDKAHASCVPCHAGHELPLSRAPAEQRWREERGPSGRRLVVTTPVYNDRTCATAECHVHPPGRQVLGLLETDVALEPILSGVASFRRGFVSLLVIAIVATSALMYLFLRSEVLGPVAALVEGTRRVAKDQLDVEVRVRSRGELGNLAASFNDMTRSLRRLEDELNGLLAGLEEQVEARTADLRNAQEQLVRTEKLSSLGKLSASIAHEINNPLAGILTFAKLVSRTLAEGPPDDARRAVLQRNLGLVEREAQRCSAIVRNLLDFARERPMAKKPVDPRAAVEEALSLIANQIAIQGVKLERHLPPLPQVLADFGQLRQAFVNVAMNACEAMGAKGGKLRVIARAPEGAVEIAFQDDGPGMPPERVGHIFDPFFTTKEKGTGLGLSVVYGIVQRHGGSIAVDSTEGEGTTFTFRLPAVPAERTAEPPAPPTPADPAAAPARAQG